MLRTLSIIVCLDRNNGIGKNGKIPWDNPIDLKYFRVVTTGSGHNVVIMGRKTWDSLSKRPLGSRINIILSKCRDVEEDIKTFDNVHHCRNKSDCLSLISGMVGVDNVFVIGGAEIYNEFMENCNKLYLSRLDDCFDCDVFFKFMSSQWKKISVVKKDRLSFEIWDKV
ncbi:dihydrofolate reductase-like domain-containing protein [Blyttiomyces helicus]|uniref:Dihydrofolate reductase n=1 Tax=Blyttiomyces helicus TaxID=388810 RepID=A0A4P9VZ04_9FUNG|nr:dihydrofolate reductase-like domain-containing protein [Blyttiomyces helicus]|eukprot:RKO84003.1 dihydrofolate reductase-like domain-containing protein [Blyttiomyces helicus]